MNRNHEIIDFAVSMPEVWSILSAKEQDLILDCYVVEYFKKNQTIYCENDIPINMMCLLSGKVKIHKEGVGGRNQIIRILKPIEYFGYRAFFAHEKYLTGASALEASEVCLVPLKIIFELVSSNSELAQYFIKLLSIDLGIADERTVNLTQKHSRGRLAESLVFLIDSYGLEEDKSINIYMAREDLANLSNMTSSNAIRTLGHFADERIVSLDGRKIKVINEDMIRKISKLG
ncbi:Crp/Fnr family transcriptional regulator [Bacteroidales bacterium]|nr:Crp/Fnr family transcriptional regulator [Bacteroidales bacterium]